MPDYLEIARKLREKAASVDFVTGLPAVTDAEKQILLDKAKELEEKYGKIKSPPTDDTTTTSRDGRPQREYNPFQRPPGWQPFDYDAWVWVQYGSRGSSAYNAPPRDDAEWERRRRESERIAEDLLKQQYRWNDKYYDEHGNPKPQDEADIVEEEYQTQADEDEDYDPEGTWYNAE